MWNPALVAALLAVGAHAGVGRMYGMRPRETELLSVRMEDNAKANANTDTNAAEVSEASPAAAAVLRRQSSSPNLANWDSQTLAACMKALSGLPAATNPSGTAVCYNLPSLDRQTGAFTADMRLFQVSSASGDFEGVPQKNIQVGLQYNGASVSMTTKSAIEGRDVGEVEERGVEEQQEEDGEGVQKRATTPKPLQTYYFVGQIDKDKMAAPMTMGALEAVVMPMVTLNGVNTAGKTVSTNVSANEAAFVNGVFSKDVILSTTARAQLAVNAEKAGLANGTVAFVLPGVNLLIFPVGLVITGFWVLAGTLVYTIGTFQRIGYRESYRRRKLVSSKPGVNARI